MKNVRGELRRLLGDESAQALGERYGGTYLSVPRHYRADHPLVLLLGADAATRLIDRFGGTQVYIATSGARGRRNDELRRGHQAGASAAELAREHGLSVRQIRRIIRG